MKSSVRWSGFAQSVSVAVVVAMVAMMWRPFDARAASGDPAAVVQHPEASRPAVVKSYDDSLRALRHVVEADRLQPPGAVRSTGGEGRRAELRVALQRVRALEVEEGEAFAATGRVLTSQEAAPEILERHRSAEAAFRDRAQRLKPLLDGVDRADAAGTLSASAPEMRELQQFLAANAPERARHHLHPEKLPWRVADATTRNPARSTETFRALVATPAAGASSAALRAAAPGQPALAAPAPSDLAETDDAQVTPAIRELAASLGGSPVRIVNWVRNNVVYLPTFGSIQGSEVTLRKKAGNAFDTASLLIALLRASGIPARYAYGTIEVPAVAAMNWVGGVSTPQAAQQLWAQGGVPNVALTTGGRITHLQLEHVWVEAWVDFAPSRGQRNVQGDTWVAVDASYKQYTEDDGLAARAGVALDAAALQQGFLSGAVVNEAEGWIQNPNGAAVEAAGAAYLTDVNAAIHAAKPDATNAEVFGTRTIVREEPQALAASLPYATIAVGARFSDIPAALTHRFRYTVYASGLDQSMGDALLSFEEALPRLAGRKITLLYAPASQADANVIASCLPKPHADGTQPGPDEFAGVQLPAYLIQLRPELRVDGVVRATGAPVTMGTELAGVGAFTSLDLSSGWDQTDDTLTAGQVTAIGLDLQGIDPRQIADVRASMEAARGQIERRELAGLTGDRVGGDLVTLTVWSYFAMVDQGGRAARARSRMVDLPALSYGLAHVDIDVAFSFGVARTARPSGIVLDIGHMRNVRWSKDGDAQAWVTYNRIMGQYASAMEHHVPEVLFVGPQTPGEAVSAVKLLALAARAGQRVYTVTAANLDAALPRLALASETLAEIRSAVAAGKEVTVHERPVSVNGWSGAGYIVIDPATGAGAYMISGGANGGKLLAAIGGYLVGLIAGVYMAALVTALTAGVASLGAFLVVGLLIASIVAVISLITAMLVDEDTYKCYVGGAVAGFAIPFAYVALKPAVQIAVGVFTAFFVKNNATIECLD